MSADPEEQLMIDQLVDKIDSLESKYKYRLDEFKAEQTKRLDFINESNKSKFKELEVY